ncbi:MAG: hypothetical protein BM556_16050 [Bacteriovorax sp. MedPE-SWde]|nr:MAG: hypothetical protein BM556_16050 [Bacteriovorax sp. MedPE-SWde]
MNRIITAIYLFLISLSVSATNLEIGVFELSPYVYKTEKGLSGALIKFLKKVEKSSNLTFSYKVLPYPRLLEDIKRDKVDIAIFYPNFKARTNRLKYIKTLGNQNYIISKRYSAFRKLKSHNNTLGIIRGANYGDLIDSHDSSKKIKLKSYEQGIKLLSADRLDYLTIPSTVFYKLCDNKKKCNSFELRSVRHVNEKFNWIHASPKMLDKKEKLLLEFKKAHNLVIRKFGYKFLHEFLD